MFCQSEEDKYFQSSKNMLCSFINKVDFCCCFCYQIVKKKS